MNEDLALMYLDTAAGIDGHSAIQQKLVKTDDFPSLCAGLLVDVLKLAHGLDILARWGTYVHNMVVGQTLNCTSVLDID